MQEWDCNRSLSILLYISHGRKYMLIVMESICPIAYTMPCQALHSNFQTSHLLLPQRMSQDAPHPIHKSCMGCIYVLWICLGGRGMKIN